MPTLYDVFNREHAMIGQMWMTRLFADATVVSMNRDFPEWAPHEVVVYQPNGWRGPAPVLEVA